ncbi:MAG: hypothetical protein KTR29_14010, partial [Rhodothermaceae bacterium]|nr:hypothetical protein [Rhodothermaceae bacterium]
MYFRRRWLPVWVILICTFVASPLKAQDENATPEIDAGLLSGLSFRGIGPALMSGRIGEIAVDPVKRSTWYVAASSGGVWKTVNAGTTWEPIFDSYPSYSIGTVAVDPNNRFTVWVGTGENNSQRSVGYGDGLYKSLDGGASFNKVGLDNSEHISRILIDPRDSDVVYVASQGPLWSSGGDRGLYKTTDGGTTWELILEIDEHTGVSDLVMDPRDPDVLYASSYQRRRHVWTLINGGPGSAIHKSTDGGETWREINKGLPSGDKGRIGLAISPVNPEIVYAIVEATGDKGGFFRSANEGESWKKMSDYVSGSPQYYQEIYADPHKLDRIYSLDTYTMVSEDGGATFTRLGEDNKHVDNHAIVFDPDDPDHLIIGSDGGIYETWDRGKTYKYFANLPLTQFYKVAVSNDEPFYYVYGGTQDNATQGGPSQTTNVHGIRNSDWFITVFGDGFDPAVDPEDPNIVYSQWQYGGLIRYDRRTGERIDIKPQPTADGPALRWNWDSALLISPHNNERIYYGSQILFQSDDRGDTWRAISGDLTRNLDRNTLEVMDRVWSVDAVAKNNSTSFYGTIVSVSESPLVEGLIYAGTDDGLVQVTEDGGETWQKIERFPGVPDMAYINDIEASLHDPNTVYVAINNHKKGDFKPYLLKSTDRGRSWSSIAGDLPERGSTYTVVQDHVDEALLFVGTEFGIFTTQNEGDSWIQLKSGIPTIAVRDLEIQRRENDLVAASFGRGFYILDDYTPLRTLNEEIVEEEGFLFPVEKAWMYIQDRPLAGSGKAFQGASFYTADNPPYGATFTYYIKESLKTRKAVRQDAEKELAKEGEDVFYPTWEELKTEDREEKPSVVLVVRDEAGEVVRRIDGKTAKGMHRATWNLRYPAFTPVSLGNSGNGPYAVPGEYTVSLYKRVDGVETELVGPTPFTVESLGTPSLPPADRDAIWAFQQETGRLQRAAYGAYEVLKETSDRMAYIMRAIESTPDLDASLYEEARTMSLRFQDVREQFEGDRTQPRRSEPGMPGILGRIRQIVGGHWLSTSAPTSTHRTNLEIAESDFRAALASLKTLVEVDLVSLEAQLEQA